MLKSVVSPAGEAIVSAGGVADFAIAGGFDGGASCAEAAEVNTTKDRKHQNEERDNGLEKAARTRNLEMGAPLTSL